MVCLIIRGVSSSATDFPCEIEESATIADLKKLLSEKYPGNPSLSLQKLIFAGRLLQDESKLADILKMYDKTTAQVFHLKVSNPTSTTTTPTSPVVPNTFQGQVPPGVQFYGQFRVGPNNFAQYPYNPMNPAFNPAFMNPALNPLMRPVYPGQFNNNNGIPQGVPQQPQQQQQQQQAQQPNQNGGEGNGHFYLFLKFAFLVYIFSQGGSTTRTVLLAIAALVAFLYQTGRLQVVATVGVNQRRNQPQQAQQVPQQQQQDVPIQNNPVDQQPNNNIPNADLPVQGGVGSVLLPFFYSLLPTWQPNVNRA